MKSKTSACIRGVALWNRTRNGEVYYILNISIIYGNSHIWKKNGKRFHRRTINFWNFSVKNTKIFSDPAISLWSSMQIKNCTSLSFHPSFWRDFKIYIYSLKIWGNHFINTISTRCHINSQIFEALNLLHFKKSVKSALEDFDLEMINSNMGKYDVTCPYWFLNARLRCTMLRDSWR